MTIHPTFNSPRLTAIGSGKGGTGKTLITLSLAHAFAHEGERVLVCDADLGLSNTCVHLGLDSGGDMAGVLSGKTVLADAVVPVLGGVKTRGGFNLLSAPAGSGAFANTQSATIGRLIAITRAACGYDRVLFDLGAGVDDTVLHFASKADESVLVMTPDPASLTDAYAFVKLMLRRGAAKPGFLVNMATSDGEAARAADALVNSSRAFLEAVPEYLGAIPRDGHIADAVRRQAPLLTRAPQSAVAEAVAQIARKLHRRLPARATAAGQR